MRCVREADLAAARVVDKVVALEPGHAVDELDPGEALQRTDVTHDEVDVVRRAAAVLSYSRDSRSTGATYVARVT